ncbi:MAG: ATP-binding protein [Bdellovibrionales bacterium]|nr:ATP-binding protein [Bdellovibrionales bacterium]
MTSSGGSHNEVAKGKVLLADNDTSEQQALGSFFSEVGWGCDVVESAERLFEALASESYDVVVTNLHMPDLSGLELLSKIRDSEGNTAVIVVCGDKNFETAASALSEGGVLDFIEKPIDYSILQSALDRIVHSLGQSPYSSSFVCEIAPVSIDETVTSRELAERIVKLDIAETLFKSGKIDLHTSLKMDLAFQEAVANCLEHGNLELESVWREEFDEEGIDTFSKLKKERLQDPHYADRTVRIQITYKDNFLEIRVSDQGNGFLPEAKEDDEDGEIRVHGRGMTIMNSVMDDVCYRNRGREVILRKTIHS